MFTVYTVSNHLTTYPVKFIEVAQQVTVISLVLELSETGTTHCQLLVTEFNK